MISTIRNRRKRPKPNLEEFREFYRISGKTSIHSYFGFRLVLAARFFDRKVTEALREQNLVTLQQWRVISQLWVREGLTVRRLAEHAAVDRAEVSRAVRELEELGLVVRRVNPEDLRSPFLSLTEKGRKVSDEVREPMRELVNSLLDGISEEDLSAAERVLHQFTERAFIR